MNVHNHSIWPPPGASHLCQPVDTALIVPAVCSAGDFAFVVANLADEE
mgnify:CR=1 FL=1